MEVKVNMAPVNTTLSDGASKLLLELYAARMPPASDEFCRELIEKGLAASVGARVELTVAGWALARRLAESGPR